MIHFSNSFVSGLLVLLCCIAGYDLWGQYLVKSNDLLFYQYSMGLQANEEMWNVGYKIENLEIKLARQYDELKNMSKKIKEFSAPLRKGAQHDFFERRKARNLLYELTHIINNTVEIRCDMNNERLRVGFGNFHTDHRDMCMLYTGAEDTESGPHTMFDVVDLGDGTMGFKSLSTGLYVQAQPPASGQNYDPWLLAVKGKLPGANERFRFSKEGYLYSGLFGEFIFMLRVLLSFYMIYLTRFLVKLGDFFSCSPNNIVSGNNFNDAGRFVVEKVRPEDAEKMRAMVQLSDEVIRIQERAVLSLTKSKHERISTMKEEDRDSRPVAVPNGTVHDPQDIHYRVAIGIPVTSKGTLMNEVSDSPIWTNLFDSFMDSIDWSSNHICFGFHIGFDRADNIYDTGDAWSEMREMFKSRAYMRLKDLLVDDTLISSILEHQLSLKLAHFDGLSGAPSQVVSELMLTAYESGFDYFYQVNDDTQIISPNWAIEFINALKYNPIASNVGVTGPLDTHNDKIFTHSFVHRTHIEIFGYYFPPSFKNWWSDDWISTVYGTTHTIR